MCGILGIVAPLGKSPGVARTVALRMRDAMTARGPDDAGWFERRNVLLAHRRLAIRDVLAGRQPWVSADGQSVLVYNGEVYNDAELRHELSAWGWTFQTRCDTEVVLAAWRRWGPVCVERLRGMFAFGVYDFRDETLFLARDRFGIKPLFLAEIDGRLAFASSIPALLAHPGFVPRPDWAAASHYLTTFRITLGPRTMFAGIRQLLPAERLLWHRGRVTVERYWDFPDSKQTDMTAEEAADAVQRSLSDAVRVRLVSDVPVGMFLSGGVDSSTIACLLREHESRPMLAACGGAAGGDDFRFARRAARHARFDHREISLDAEEYWQTWQFLLDEYATPVSTPTDVILYRLAAEMQRSVGVVLGGEGADELFCGYEVAHWSARDYELSLRVDSPLWPYRPHAVRLFLASTKRCYGRTAFDSSVDHYFALNSLIPTDAKPALLDPQVWREADEDGAMRDRYAALLGDDGFRDDADDGPIQRTTRLLHRANLESLLARLDSATMLASLEARVPFTDHHLVETAFRLPVPMKIHVAGDESAPWLAAGELSRRGSLRSKHVLRRVAARLMPRELAHRRKASFPTPLARWLTGEWKTRVGDSLRHSPFARAVLRPQALQELVASSEQAGMSLWPLVNLAAWGDRQFAA